MDDDWLLENPSERMVFEKKDNDYCKVLTNVEYEIIREIID